MQSSYLCNAKGAIDKDAVALINRAQQFRNKVVHRVGIVEIGESELIEEIQSIDSVIDVLSALQKDDLEKLKGVNLRSDRASE
jgi:uncharacterized protein YutE (UPF0331/DUF86 family)